MRGLMGVVIVALVMVELYQVQLPLYELPQACDLLPGTEGF